MGREGEGEWEEGTNEDLFIFTSLTEPSLCLTVQTLYINICATFQVSFP